jgi:hypothetical protein
MLLQKDLTRAGVDPSGQLHFGLSGDVFSIL